MRRFGYRIESRREGEQAVWRKNGILFSESDALLRVSKEIASVEGRARSEGETSTQSQDARKRR